MADFSPSTARPCPLPRTGDAVPGSDAWAAWEAGLDAARAAVQGPPDRQEVALAEQCAAQERILFGRVRTPALRPFDRVGRGDREGRGRRDGRPG